MLSGFDVKVNFIDSILHRLVEIPENDVMANAIFGISYVGMLLHHCDEMQ